MADERAEATMKHDMQLEVAAESMREAHTQLRLAGSALRREDGEAGQQRHEERRGLVGEVLTTRRSSPGETPTLSTALPRRWPWR